MANRRMIYQDFFEDDYFGMVEIGLRLLWIGLITAAADDQGRILDNTALIRSKVFMYDGDIADSQIDNWLSKLNADNKVVRYEADGKRLIQIVNWWNYQTPAWASSSKFQEPEGWTDKVRCHVSGSKQGGKIETMNWDKQGGYQDAKLRSKQGSYLPTGIDDVNVNDDINDNDDSDNDSNLPKRSPLMVSFCEVTGIPLPFNPSHYAKWDEEIAEWEKMKVKDANIQAAFDKAQEKGYTVSRPQSLTNFIRGDIAKQKSQPKSNEDIVNELIERGEL